VGIIIAAGKSRILKVRSFTRVTPVKYIKIRADKKYTSRGLRILPIVRWLPKKTNKPKIKRRSRMFPTIIRGSLPG
jgi:hypothetical protein